MYHIFSNKSGVLYFRYVVPKAVLDHFPKLQKTYNRSLGTPYRREAKNKAVCFYADIHTRLEDAVKLVDKLHKELDMYREMCIATLLPEMKIVAPGDVEQLPFFKGCRRCLHWLQEQELIDELKPENIEDAISLCKKYVPMYQSAEEEVEKKQGEV